jgi:acyl-CoA synthetase (AMP-forming)/AMP-acid ligase II
MSEPVPPISTQVSRLAELAPGEPAVTCEGRTITRGQLDTSTNRLARAYAERGVRQGDYVTIAMPNSIEWIQALIACWKLGALGYFDADGFLYLSDRRVDMFAVGGRNVYRAEIESALSAHPNVLSCLVVGVPDNDLGQVAHAIVQADGLDDAAVIAFLAERIAGYKVPRTVEFSDMPLRDDAGKARRSAVRDEVIARRARAGS